MNEEHKFDYLGPGGVLSGVTAFIGDVACFFAILSFFIPIIGLALGPMGLMARYAAGGIMLAFAWKHLRGGWMPKAALLLGFLVPIPGLLMVGLIAAIILQNRYAQMLAIAAIGVATGGIGAAAEAGEVAAGAAAAGAETAAAAAAAGAEIGAAGAELAAGAAEAGAAGAEVAAGAAETGAAAAEEAGVAAGREAAEEISPEALGGQKEIPERLKEELFERTPQGGGEEKPEDEQRSAELDDENNEVNLRNAA